jgi:S1-C subfamily serine protease
LLEHGRVKLGYLGLAGQPVRLTDRQRGADLPEDALLVVGVTPGSPADGAGILVGDVMIEFDGHPVGSPEDLLELLAGDRVGRRVTLKVSRGEKFHEISVTVGERPE